ncbi:S-layer homology domain-containing protein [Niameybacter massiliensis]|uniref:S-layer homology domain-containing protein n=1 Tax=Holtiella tumoricola TaxID=3018743 RepID=A0AA42J0I2_9FIRM|nr:S-layer homology domain-containing protein [Holtiella tumoricola]MDA3731404.1 S-layer homology domain-containing protein [Holtiella tumoricola]
MREKLKKSASLLLILCLVLSVIGGSAYAAHRYFEDAKGHWAEEAIQKLTEQGVIAGYPDGLCHPDEMITRAEFATLLARTLAENVPTTENKMIFADISGHWAESSICYLLGENIIVPEEYENNHFEPNKLITRLEMVKMIVRVLGMDCHSEDCLCDLDFTDISFLEKEDQLYLCIGNKQFIINGYPDGSVKPNDNATRGEAFEMLVKEEEAKDKLEQEQQKPPVVKPDEKPSGGGNGGGGSSYVPAPQFAFTIPENCYVGDELKIAPTSKYVSTVSWSITKDELPVELAKSFEGELTKDGGTLKAKEVGKYTITATAKNSRGKEVIHSQTVTIYPVVGINFTLPETAHTDTSIALDLKTENLSAYPVVWTVTKNGETADLAKVITGSLGNTGGTIQFKEHGSYTLTAAITDSLGKVSAVSQSIVVYPVVEVKLTLPNLSHTDKTVILQTESKNAEGLTADWVLTKDGAPVGLESQIEGNVSLADSNIRFKEKGVYQLTITLTDKTGRAFADTAKITVYPVGVVGFYLPSILHTDDTVKVETTLTEIGEKQAVWTVFKNGTEVSLENCISGTLTNNGGNIRFKDKGEYMLKCSFTDEGGRKYAYEQAVKVYPVPTVTYTQPKLIHTDTEVEINTTTTDLDDLTLEWLVDNTFGYQDWNTFVTGKLHNEGGSIHFKRVGIYELVARITDETGRVFLFEPKNKTEVLPVLALGFTLPEIAYTDTQINIRTSGHNNTLPVEWTLTKDGKEVYVVQALDGTLNKLGGKVTFKEHGNYVLTATMTDLLGRSYAHSESITIMPIFDFAFTMPVEVHYGTEFAVTVEKAEHMENAAVAWTLTKDDVPANYTGTLTKSGGTIAVADTGTFTLTSVATDRLGRESRHSQKVSITNTAPMVTSITATPTRTVKDGKFFVNITATANDTDGDTTTLEWENRTADDYYAVGTHTIRVRAKDIAGAYSEWSEKTFTIQNSAPTVTLTATPTRTVKNGKFLVSITATANDTDGDITTLEWENRTADDYYAVGTHTIRVRAKDVAGAYSEWSEKTFTIQSFAPTVTLTVTPTRTVKNGKFLVNITATANDTDGDTTTLEWENKVADNYYAVGTYTIRVRAKDSTGLYSDWVSKTFTIQSSAPTRPVIARTPNSNSVAPGTAVTITAESTDADGDAITYVWENRPNESHVYSLGKNVVRVKAVDATGAESPWAAIVFFVADSNGSGGMTLTGPDSTILENGIEGATITKYTFTVPPVSGHSGNDYGRVRGYNVLTKQWDQLDYGTTSNGISFERNLNSRLYSKLEFYYYTNHNCMYNKSNITYSVEYFFE